MKRWFRFLTLVLPVLFLSGCVTSYYKNDKGEECKQQYLTTLGISIKKCGIATVSALAPGQQGSAGTSAQQAQGGPIVSNRDPGVTVTPVAAPAYEPPQEVEPEAPAEPPSKDLPMGPIASMGN